MIHELKFNRVLFARGGNKFINQKGLTIAKVDDKIKFGTINSKDGNHTTDMRFELPEENIQDLIDLLNTLK